jgi:hypothetical protein
VKNALIVISGIWFFSSIALFRGISLGQDIDKKYLVITIILTVIFGIWLHMLNKNDKASSTNINSDN